MKPLVNLFLNIFYLNRGFSVVFYAIFIKHDFNPTYFVKQMGFSTKSTKTNLNYQSHMTKTSS